LKPVLDATAGKRAMWPNKNPPNVIFMDKEHGFPIDPDVIAVWEYLPFRNDVFSTTFFDPPHVTWFLPITDKMDTHKPWWGKFDNRKHMVLSLIKSSKEFSRITSRLCFKWGENVLKLQQALSCLREWIPIYYYKTRPRTVNGVHHKGGSAYWVTMDLRSIKGE